MFQINHVIEACCTFLEHQLDPSNCIGIADFSQTHGCSDLYNKAKLFIYENFADVSKSEEFMMLSPSQLVQVLKRDELNVRCESEVYNAVTRWVGFEPEKRCQKMESLLNAVRCHFLTPCFLTEQLKKCPLLGKNMKCKDYLKKICEDIMRHKRCQEKRRTPKAPHVVYTVGGYLRHSLGNVECYNPCTAQWLKLADLPVPRSGVAVCVAHGLIYVLGGRNNSADGNMDIAAVDCYDPFTNAWRKCQDMTVARNRVGCGVIDGQVYAVGGSYCQTHHQSVEKLVDYSIHLSMYIVDFQQV
jgi:kelch-like protein 19